MFKIDGKMGLLFATVTLFAMGGSNSSLHGQPPGGGGPGGLSDETPIALDVELFADLVEAELDGNCTGWQFAVYRDAVNIVNRAGGMARTSEDAPARSMSTSDRLEIASCSKTINAIATLSVLEQYGISIDASIIDYVPPSWNPDPSIGDISFWELLSHNSGLAKTAELDALLDGAPGQHSVLARATLEGGVINPGVKDYENINYAIARVVVAYIAAAELLIPLEGDDAAHEVAVADAFAAVVRQHVFIPAGLGSNVFATDWHPSGNGYDHARYYNFTNPGAAGFAQGPDYAGLGPGGWDMTAWQMAQVIAAWEAGYLIEPGMVAVMKELEMGIWDGEWDGDATLGAAYTHNGGFGDSNGGGESRLISFPGNVQFALIVNSKYNDFASTFTFVADAFLEATQPADLVVTSLQTNGAPSYDGDTLKVPVRLTVHNQGNGGVQSSFFNGIRFGNTFRWSAQMSPLAAGESAVKTGIVRIPDAGRLLAGRSVRLVAHADAAISGGDTTLPSWARIHETDESNNQATLTVTAPGGSLDLTTDPPADGLQSGGGFKLR